MFTTSGTRRTPTLAEMLDTVAQLPHAPQVRIALRSKDDLPRFAAALGLPLGMQEDPASPFMSIPVDVSALVEEGTALVFVDGVPQVVRLP